MNIKQLTFKMYLNNYQLLKNKETYLLILLFIFSLTCRIPSIFIFGDINLENEWNILVNNLYIHGKFSLNNFDKFFVPNLFMPPLYAFYLYFFKFFNFSDILYIKVILFSQAILSSFSVLIFYKINKFFFSNKISIFLALVFSLLPLHIYACGQISSIVLQSFLSVVFLLYFLKVIKKNNVLNIFLLSLSSGLLILLRGEFIALFILSILYLALFLKINLKSIFTILILTSIIISPYLIRNIMIFNKVTITNSFGWNLWKGNHPKTKVEGNAYYNYNINLEQRVNKVAHNKYYEINVDKIFLEEGILNIKNNPYKYFNLYIKKIFSFIFVDLNSSMKNYYHPMHYIPILIISIGSFVGIFYSDKKSYEFNFFILFFIAQTMLVSLFFILPRYKLGIIPFQIIFCGVFIDYIKNKFFKPK